MCGKDRNCVAKADLSQSFNESIDVISDEEKQQSMRKFVLNKAPAIYRH